MRNIYGCSCILKIEVMHIIILSIASFANPFIWARRTQPSRRKRLTISLAMTLFLLLSPGLILLRTFSLLDRLLTMFTLKVKQCCFKQHSKGEWKNNKFDLEISLLPKSKLELKKLEHFFFKMCHNLVFMERETFDTFSTLIFSTYSPGSKLNSRNLPTPIMNGL